MVNSSKNRIKDNPGHLEPSGNLARNGGVPAIAPLAHLLR
jgi:hypothetical protein